jgi:hypothetical protein
MNSTTGPAFVCGVNHALAAIKLAMRSGDRSQAKLFHSFAPGSEQELAFDEGAQYATVRAMAGAEFAVQCRSEYEPRDN